MPILTFCCALFLFAVLALARSRLHPSTSRRRPVRRKMDPMMNVRVRGRGISVNMSLPRTALLEDIKAEVASKVGILEGRICFYGFNAVTGERVEPPLVDERVIVEKAAGAGYLYVQDTLESAPARGGGAADGDDAAATGGFKPGVNRKLEASELEVAGAALVELPADDQLVVWLHALCAVDLAAVDKSVQLPAGVHWPDLKSPILYVRPFYKPLWETVLNGGMHTKALSSAVILGSPGIAKSAFGLYAVLRAVKAGRTVIYSSRKGSRVMFKGGKAYCLPADFTNLRELNDATALYICDGLPPVAYKSAFLLLITSPKKDNWSETQKSPAVSLFVLPNFTPLEMEELRALAFSSAPCCSAAEAAERMLKWGGNPRNVLTKAADEGWQRALECAPSTLSLTVAQQALSFSSALNGVAVQPNCHRLVNLVPYGATPGSELEPSTATYFLFHHAELVTPYVEEKVAQQLVARELSEVNRFLHQASADPSLQSFSGVLYERIIVLPCICSGGESLHAVPLMRLSAASPELTQPMLLRDTTLDMSCGLRLLYFRDVAELSGLWAADASDALFVPRSKQFPVVDFVLRIGGQAILANATVSASHDVKVDNLTFGQLLRAVGLLGGGGAAATTEIPLIWVLPQKAFDAFCTPGPLKSPKGGALASVATARTEAGRRLMQYKLMLEIPGSGAAAAGGGGGGAAACATGGSHHM